MILLKFQILLANLFSYKLAVVEGTTYCRFLRKGIVQDGKFRFKLNGAWVVVDSKHCFFFN